MSPLRGLYVISSNFLRAILSYIGGYFPFLLAMKALYGLMIKQFHLKRPEGCLFNSRHDFKQPYKAF